MIGVSKFINDLSKRQVQLKNILLSIQIATSDEILNVFRKITLVFLNSTNRKFSSIKEEPCMKMIVKCIYLELAMFVSCMFMFMFVLYRLDGVEIMNKKVRDET